MIEEISAEDVIDTCREALGLPANHTLEESLLAGLLRRVAHILCPCSRATLRSIVADNCKFLHPDEEELKDLLDDLIEELTVSGDLLELQDVTVGDLDAKSTWIFAAPPSFITRRSGSVFLTGIVPNQRAFLPESLNNRIVYARTTRRIDPRLEENLRKILKEQGLRELPESVWLRAPGKQTPDILLNQSEARLMAEPQCAPVDGLEILDSSKNVTYYKGRWAAPTNQSGVFIARRPQEYGGPLWCFVELTNGVLRRLINLPMDNYRWRGCDAAWHLQLAIDCSRGQPQQYRRKNTENGVRFDFFSPLPLWAERRLMILGERRLRDKNLIAYEIPAAEAAEEERWLQENLWLEPVKDADTSGDH